MECRRFGAAVCCTTCGTTAGCLAADESEPEPVIDSLKLENHRQTEGYEYTVQIENEEEFVFEESQRLGPAGSGNDATAFEDPVDPGAYTVRVTADEYSATAKTQALVADEKPCLRFKFHLSSKTLHMEHRSYNRSE